MASERFSTGKSRLYVLDSPVAGNFSHSSSVSSPLPPAFCPLYILDIVTVYQDGEA